MTDFILKKLPYDLTSNAGLALVGQYIKRLGLSHRVDRKFPVGIGGIANSDILKSYLGLLVQGKNDFDAVEAFRGDDFFTRSLGVGIVPSCSTMRQRMDTHAASWFELAGEFNLALLSAQYATGSVDFGALPCGYMALDWDTFVMDNAGTQKEAVGRTYQGVDGYTPSATLPGLLGLLPGIGLAPWRAALGAGDRAEPGAGLADGGKADPTAAVVPCRLGAVFPDTKVPLTNWNWSLGVMNTVSTSGINWRFMPAIWNSYSKSLTARRPRTTTLPPISTTKSRNSPRNAVTSTFL